MFQDPSASNSTQQYGLELRRTLRPNDDSSKNLKPVHTTRVGPVALRDPGSEIPTDGEMRGCSKWGGPHTTALCILLRDQRAKYLSFLFLIKIPIVYCGHGFLLSVVKRLIFCIPRNRLMIAFVFSRRASTPCFLRREPSSFGRHGISHSRHNFSTLRSSTTYTTFLISNQTIHLLVTSPSPVLT
jgi:hypothetical protein